MRPYVKWAYEPLRAEDVPAAIARGYYLATQAPMGPVFISIPMDDWTHECPMVTARKVTKAVMPAVQANAWQQYNSGKAKVSPDTLGIPKP